MTEEDKQDQLVEQLSEKRTSTRVGALARLIDDLQMNWMYDFVSDRLDTLQLYVLASVRKGETPEVVLACRALEVIALTMGTEAEKLVAEATPVLNEVLKNGSRSGTARAATAEAIGLLNFVGSASDFDTEAAMQMLITQLRVSNLPEALASSAWEAWALLATTLPTHKLAGELLSSYLPALMQYLDHESIDVKTAAGECIALLWEAHLEVEAEKEEEEGAEGSLEDELDSLSMLPDSAVPTIPVARKTSRSASIGSDSDKSTASPQLSAATRSPALNAFKRSFRPTKLPGPSSRASGASSSSAAASSGVPPSDLYFDKLVGKLSALARDSGRQQSKKQRATQKRTFRELLRTVEDGEVPDESLKIEKSRHEFFGWRSLLQLDVIRDVLAKGLNCHFVHNPLLQDVFELTIESGDGVDDPARKEVARAQSKAKERRNFEDRDRSRRKKMALQLGEEQD